MDPARIPLGEDWELRGMPPLHHIHATYKWNETNTIKYSAMSQVCYIHVTKLHIEKDTFQFKFLENRAYFSKKFQV